MLVIVLSLCSVSLIACGDKTPTTETVTVYGEFYKIDEAFMQQIISFENLNYIDNNINDMTVFTYMSDIQKEKIIHDYKQTHIPSSNDIEVIDYGVYNGSIVVKITDRYYENIVMQDTLNNYSIDKFYDGNKWNDAVVLKSEFYKLRVWRENREIKEIKKPKTPYGAFYSVRKAREHGFITDEEIKSGFDPTCTLKDISGGQDTEDKIVHDFKLLDMKKREFQSILYYGEYRGSIVVIIIDGNYYDAFEQLYPQFCVWRPFVDNK